MQTDSLPSERRESPNFIYKMAQIISCLIGSHGGLTKLYLEALYISLFDKHMKYCYFFQMTIYLVFRNPSSFTVHIYQEFKKVNLLKVIIKII